MSSQSFVLRVPASEWLLQNHRDHYQKAAIKRRSLRSKAGWAAKALLVPVEGAVAVYGQAEVPKGVLPDADAIAPMMKAILDGLVDAGIIRDDTGREVPLIGYFAPVRNRALEERQLRITVEPFTEPFTEKETKQ